jgi:hypothetical protein
VGNAEISWNRSVAKTFPTRKRLLQKAPGVIPAKAGIPVCQRFLDPGLRRGDENREFCKRLESNAITVLLRGYLVLKMPDPKSCGNIVSTSRLPRCLRISPVLVAGFSRILLERLVGLFLQFVCLELAIELIKLTELF